MDFDLKELPSYIELLNDAKKDFLVTMGNYTTVLKVGKKTLVFRDTKKPIDRSQFAKCIAVNRRIKKELEEHLYMFDDFDLTPSDIDYFDASDLEFECDSVFNIDLKQAYPTVLTNLGLLSKETVKKLSALDKKYRLMALGILAYEPTLFNYKNGELTGTKTRKSEYKKVFFYCVKTVSDLMEKIKNEILKEDYIFFWTDGIYFKPNPKKLKEINNFLLSNDYNHSFDFLTDFKMDFDEKGVYYKYKKDGKEKTIYCTSRKTVKENRRSKLLAEYLLTNDLQTLKTLSKYL